MGWAVEGTPEYDVAMQKHIDSCTSEEREIYAKQFKEALQLFSSVNKDSLDINDNEVS